MEAAEPSAQMAISGELTARPPQLTSRQTAIVRMIAAGRTDKELARELGMSRATVHTHLARLFRRFGVHNRAALVATWIRDNV